MHGSPISTTCFTPDYDRRIAQFWLASPGFDQVTSHPQLHYARKLQEEFKADDIILSINQLRKRFDLMCSDALQFSMVYHKANKMSFSLEESINTSEAQLLETVKEQFHKQTKLPFLFESAWYLLRQHPSWMKNVATEGTYPSESPSASSYDPAADSPDDSESNASESDEEPIVKSATIRRISLRLAAKSSQTAPPSAPTTHANQQAVPSKPINKPAPVKSSTSKRTLPTPTPWAYHPEPRSRPSSCFNNPPTPGQPAAASTTHLNLATIPEPTPSHPSCSSQIRPTDASSSSLTQASPRESSLISSSPPITTTHTAVTPKASKGKEPQTDFKSCDRKRNFDAVTQTDATPQPSKGKKAQTDFRSCDRRRYSDVVIKIESDSEPDHTMSQCPSGGLKSTNKARMKTHKLSYASTQAPAPPSPHPALTQPYPASSGPPGTINQTDRLSTVPRVKHSPDHIRSSQRRTLDETGDTKPAVMSRETRLESISSDEIRVSGTQNVEHVQLELKRMEAKRESERAELEIMKKDLRTCTDEYEKEYFLFKKRKILSRLKAQDALLT
ncbi:hypothetical protein PCANC_16612 [Puccinia coronata f. sp. avenae]|uniref:No apical meristem-associated C-terminal domain-containing protein n=1 Tax=Puccinia coronata f. sp. avenae TaxID=200324 RepID=A0A2N5S6F4_9BASI|nr:hypothetical protein PCANC_16612 [Puccinia coronata f. sp. avenae]